MRIAETSEAKTGTSGNADQGDTRGMLRAIGRWQRGETVEYPARSDPRIRRGADSACRVVFCANWQLTGKIGRRRNQWLHYQHISSCFISGPGWI